MAVALFDRESIHESDNHIPPSLEVLKMYKLIAKWKRQAYGRPSHGMHMLSIYGGVHLDVYVPSLTPCPQFLELCCVPKSHEKS